VHERIGCGSGVDANIDLRVRDPVLLQERW
jgi:hypothetical protein